jgi:hypothetical protein
LSTSVHSEAIGLTIHLANASSGENIAAAIH